MPLYTDRERSVPSRVCRGLEVPASVEADATATREERLVGPPNAFRPRPHASRTPVSPWRETIIEISCRTQMHERGLFWK